ncbi:MAG TPA: DUF1800 domain-containing protein [Parvularcula sp.]|nr:DUF1800 domain-containing protein [Parvularcula sp.]
MTRARRAALAAGALALAACAGEDAPSAVAPAGAPPAPSVADTPSAADASRFLMQATFGPTQSDIDELVSIGYSAWMRRQFNASSESNVSEIRRIQADYAARGDTVEAEALADIAWRDMIDGEDQLRQRMVFALSQIFVVSYENSDVAETLASAAFYMDVLEKNAFGNHRDLIEDVTYSPSMAQFLTYLNNRKEDPSENRVPDENYAREIMQLFTIGLVELNPDGSPRLDGSGNTIETYDNTDITGLAKVFTGLSWADGDFGGRFADRTVPVAFYSPLAIFEEEHSTSEKAFLNVTIPANTPAAQSIDIALDALFNHPNAAPFFARQMIQRFVTSNPSPQYVRNVAAAYETGFYQLPDGQAVGSLQRGDMRAVIAAVLLDDEARLPASRTDPNFGKVREPVIRFTHWARVADLNSASVLGEGNLDGQRALEETAPPTSLGQQAYRSPSVFNFYRPGYVAPGLETGDLGLVAPELQIVTTASVTSYANFMMDRIEEADALQTYRPGYSRELSLADNPPALVDRLNLVMTAGAMEPTTRDAIIAAVNGVPLRAGSEPQDRRRRVNAAMLMTVLSPEYYTQR